MKLAPLGRMFNLSFIVTYLVAKYQQVAFRVPFSLSFSDAWIRSVRCVSVGPGQMTENWDCLSLLHCVCAMQALPACSASSYIDTYFELLQFMF